MQKKLALTDCFTRPQEQAWNTVNAVSVVEFSGTFRFRIRLGPHSKCLLNTVSGGNFVLKITESAQKLTFLFMFFLYEGQLSRPVMMQ
jgi:hypothetical protein